jgi:hypothetical protein
MSATSRIETSQGVLQALHDVGIRYDRGRDKINGLREGTLAEFIEAYAKTVATRDEALTSYLQGTPEMFRSYVGPSTRTFDTVSQVLWYMDEIVTLDPLTHLVNRNPAKPLNLQNAARKLRTIFRLTPYINAGRVLLAGPSLAPRVPDTPPAAAEALANDSEVRAALDKSVRFEMGRRPDANGNKWLMYRAGLDTGAVYGVGQPQPPLPGTHASPVFSGSDPLPATTLARLTEATGGSAEKLLEKVRSLYPGEVGATLLAVQSAAALRAAALFDRDVDELILRRTPENVDRRQRAATIDTLKLALPYLRGATPQQLLTLREELPEAFKEFRSRMEAVVRRALVDDPENAMREARVLAEREIIPSIRALKADLASSARKTRIAGYGSAVMYTLGSLAAAIAPTLPGIGAVGAVLAGGGAVAAWSASSGDRVASTKNPFYFVWRATTT